MCFFLLLFREARDEGARPNRGVWGGGSIDRLEGDKKTGQKQTDTKKK